MRGRGTIVVVRLVEARYENGVLLPVDRLGLRPGESVNLIVVRRPVAGRWDLPKLAKAGSAEDLAGTALIDSSPSGVPPEDSVALAFQMPAIPKSALQAKIRDLVESEVEELELATDEALGRVEPK